MLLARQRQLGWEAFLDGLLNESSPHRSTVQVMTHSAQSLSGWAWGVHFAPLHYFVDRQDARTVYVCYSRHQMRNRLACMAEDMKMRCNFSAISVTNPTRGNKGHSTSARSESRDRLLSSVPPRLQQLLQIRLSLDEAIYGRHCSHCEATSRCCHSTGHGMKLQYGHNSHAGGRRMQEDDGWAKS
eukprot:scaffold22058_cov39-Tisochrysis_lutea.AAC.2